MHDLCTGLLPALLPLIKTALRINYLQSGLLLSALTITSGLSQFPGGWLGDRYSRTLVIAIGLTGVSLTALAVGLNSSYYPILVSLVIMGIVAGAYHPSATSFIYGHYDEARRGKVISLHMAGGSIGFALGPVLGGLIAETLEWRFAYIILSVPTLVAALWVLKKFGRQAIQSNDKLPNNISTRTSHTFELTSKWRTIIRVLRPVAMVITLTIATQFVAGTAMAFIPIYLVDKHNVAPASAAMLMGAVRGGGIVGSLLGGWLSDRWGRKKTVFLALAATGPVLYLLTWLPFNPSSMIFFILFGMIMYMRQATIQPLLMDNTPPHLRATVFGIYFGLGMEGMSLLQPVAGHFMDIFGSIEIFHIIALISLTLSLAALLIAKWPKLHR